MNVQPVIQRELQVASRRRETWRLRLYFGAGTVASSVFGILLPRISSSERGQVVLVCLAVCGFVLSLFAGAYLTADAVSSEKRDGTLGLLFLTPLDGWQIVAGKMVTHSLQVSYALLAGFPLFFLPILLGGVVWSEVARILLVLLATLLLSLACGMFWSTVVTEARTAVLATTVTMILLTLLPWLWVFIEEKFFRRLQLVGLPQAAPLTALILAFEGNYRRFGSPGLGGASGAFIYWGSVWCSLGCSAVLVAVSGWLLPRVWRRTEAGARPTKRSQLPKALRVLRTLPARTLALDAAPLLWLAARELREALWLRVLRWATLLFFSIVLVVSVTTRHWEEGFSMAFFAAYGLHLVTRIQLALAATRRLHEDRRSGALEALLTTPVSVADIVQAHHESLKRAFLGPLLLLLAMNGALEAAVVLFPGQLHMDGGTGALFTAFFVGGAAVTLADFVTLRWLGLRESLRNPTQLRAAGRAFVFLVAGAWPGFAAALLVAVAVQQERLGALVFGCWFAGCLVYDRVVIRSCRKWLQAGLRRRASEG